MQDEAQIRRRKSDLTKAIEYENEIISNHQREIDACKQRIKSHQDGLKEINRVLEDC